jgi:phospholipase B1
VAVFDCDVYPASARFAPHSAKFLRPGDIKILAALGDSLTAGFGAKSSSIDDLFNEYRGVSFSSSYTPHVA